jgi:biotin transport system substrate-specific component
MSQVHVAPLRAFLAERRAIWRISAVVGGSWVIAASSWVSAPMYPVPMTMQTFAILLVAGLAGARLGAAIVITWLAQAALGLPFLAEGAGGLAPFEGPTTGYLAGFFVAVIVCGWLAERPRLRGWLPMMGVFLLGHMIILGIGWARLAVMTDPQTAFDSGVWPFLIGSVLKSFLAVAVIRLVEPWIRSLSR